MTTRADQTRGARQRLDTKLAALRPADRLSAPPRGWVKAVRAALGMSQADLAARLRVSPQAVQQIEANEADGSVRLATLRRAAEAMDCTLVYAVVPRTTLEGIVRSRAEAVLREATAAAERTMALEGQSATVPDDVSQAALDALIRSRRLWRK